MSKRIEVIGRLREMSHSDDACLALTSALVQLNQMLSDPETDAKDLARVIELDPMLTSTVLRSANAASFGLVRKVTHVRQAVNVIGLSRLQQVFSFAVLDRILRSDQKEQWENLWKHSLGTAVAAQILCNYIDPRSADSMFTAGLLHDLGSFVINRFLPEESAQVIEMLKKDPDRRLLVAEKEILGLSHQEIGAFFAKEWNFPDIIVECIRQHHFIGDSEYKEWVGIVMLANNIAKGMELGWSENYLVEPIPNWVWGMLKIPEKDFSKLVQQVRNQFDNNLASIE